MRRLILMLTVVFALAGSACAQAPYVTLTGTMQGANGLPASNTVLDFTPTQPFFLPGTNTTQQVGNIYGNGAPVSPCEVSGQLYTDLTPSPHVVYECIFGVWVPFSSFANYGFANVLPGTNTNGAMLVGTGSSLGPTGSGTVNANLLGGIAISGTPSSGQVLEATGPSAAAWHASPVVGAAQFAVPYYSDAGTGTTISGVALTGLVYFQASGAPRAATAGDIYAAGAVARQPDAAQVVTQPSGGDLAVNEFNGGYLARLYQTGGGNNGLANLFVSSQLSGGGTVVADPLYATTESLGFINNGDSVTGFAMPSGTTVVDQRVGVNAWWQRGAVKNSARGIWANRTTGCFQDTMPGAGATGPWNHTCEWTTSMDTVPGYAAGPGGYNSRGKVFQYSVWGAALTAAQENDIYCGSSDCQGQDWEFTCKCSQIIPSDEGGALYRANMFDANPYLTTIATGGGGHGATSLTLDAGGKIDGLGALNHPFVDLDDDVISATGSSVTSPGAVATVTLTGATVPVQQAAGTFGSSIPDPGRTDGVLTAYTTTVATSTPITAGTMIQIYSGVHLEAYAITAVGTWSAGGGGTQSITFPHYYGHAGGESWTIGGAAGRYLENTRATNGNYRYLMNVVGSPTSTTVLVTVQTQAGNGSSNQVQNGIAGALKIYHGTVLMNAQDATANNNVTGRHLTVGPNDADWTNGAHVENTNNINGFGQAFHVNLLNNNPYYPYTYERVAYQVFAGGFFGGDHSFIANFGDGTCSIHGGSGCLYVDEGGGYFPLSGMHFNGGWAGLVWDWAPQTNLINGNVKAAALLYVGQRAPGSTNDTLDVFLTGGDSIGYTWSTRQFRFNGASALYSNYPFTTDYDNSSAGGGYFGGASTDYGCSPAGPSNWFGLPAGTVVGGNACGGINLAMPGNVLRGGGFRVGDKFNQAATMMQNYGSSGSGATFDAGILEAFGHVSFSVNPTAYPYLYLLQTNNAVEVQSAWLDENQVLSVPAGVKTTQEQPLVALPSGAGSTSGGTIPAGTYIAEIVGVDAAGNTTTASGDSNAVTTTGTTSSIAWSWTAIPGAATYRIYNVRHGGAGTVGNAFFTSGTNSYTQTTFTAGAVAPPTVNSTGGFGVNGYVSGLTLQSRGLLSQAAVGTDASGFLVAASNIPNAMLQNSSITVGGASCTLGGSCTPGGSLLVYDAGGDQQASAHVVTGAGEMTAGTLAVTLSGSAVYSNSTSYVVTATDITSAAAVQVTRTDGSHFTLTGTSGDSVNYIVVGN